MTEDMGWSNQLYCEHSQLVSKSFNHLYYNFFRATISAPNLLASMVFGACYDIVWVPGLQRSEYPYDFKAVNQYRFPSPFGHVGVELPPLCHGKCRTSRIPQTILHLHQFVGRLDPMPYKTLDVHLNIQRYVALVPDALRVEMPDMQKVDKLPAIYQYGPVHMPNVTHQ